MKKVGKTSRPFRYDLNQIPYEVCSRVWNLFEHHFPIGLRVDLIVHILKDKKKKKKKGWWGGGVRVTKRERKQCISNAM